MATIPTPRSYNQILADMISAFLSKYGLKGITVASPVLAIMEAAAQADFRQSADIFTLLNSISLDRAEGTALDRIALDEGTERLGDTASTGYVTITDTRYTKISTKIYQGTVAPVANSTVINVADASKFPASGSIYLGRGTTNFEGPLAYTSISNLGNYYAITLSSPTQKYHNVAESVILAQGGNRSIASGTVVQTPQGNAADSVTFSTTFLATIPDGEVTIEDVLVSSDIPGEIGNISANAISSFVSDPFPGASVYNPLPFTNGQSSEDDDTLRERIKALRASRTKGTSLAITTGVTGITSSDENKRVQSSSLLVREGEADLLVIDDGTGYELKSSGIAIETLADSATGGELYFQLAYGRPVTKARLITNLTAPFNLIAGSVLAVIVADKYQTHTFDSSDFKSINNATAYEIADSINKNSALDFIAYVVGDGLQVSIEAQADINEKIQVVTPTDTSLTNANTFLGFPVAQADTVKLYKNDQLLIKDGKIASITSNVQSAWGTLSGSQTLTLAVDGTPSYTVTFSDTDFINNNTGYTTLSNTNTLASWATVFNSKMPGVTASVSNGTIVLTSNKGLSGDAKLEIISGDLVTNGVFNVSTDTGENADYTLDRNLGQIKLASALAVGDSLSAGSLYTRAFIESIEFPHTTVTPYLVLSNSKIWLFLDDPNLAIIPTAITGSSSITVTYTHNTFRQRFASANGTFTNVKIGDWLVAYDSKLSALNTAIIGAFRVCNIDTTNHSYVEIENYFTGTTVSSSTTLAELGMTFIRTSAIAQQVSISSGNYTAQNMVDTLNASLTGCFASTFQTNYVRITTDEFDSNGSIFIIADKNAKAIGFK